jgi:hypothetical protein
MFGGSTGQGTDTSAGMCPKCGYVGWFEVNETAARDFEAADHY